MLDILRKSWRTGVVTTKYPAEPSRVSPQTLGAPEVAFDEWRDARPAAASCPTGAIQVQDSGSLRTVTVDMARCTFCAQCAEADPTAIRMTPRCELAATDRRQLVTTAQYRLKPDGTQGAREETLSRSSQPPASAGSPEAAMASEIRKLLGRSLHIRQVDAGSCNGCELEIQALNSPVYDLERLGIHFVASPRHADLLLVTGPVTRNMELALKKTYDATPPPRLVVAVGACGCSGGIFGRNYATCGAVDQVIPVDVYIPGCPPNPYALLHGILLAVGRGARPQPSPNP
jgi:Ni,Fe-hydrogenase III small subunit/formate hydrogenlyase subunit 6/NADH:ubiquinone oxidoreductase subunit I